MDRSVNGIEELQVGGPVTDDGTKLLPEKSLLYEIDGAVNSKDVPETGAAG
jgi:hypothetical protein